MYAPILDSQKLPLPIIFVELVLRFLRQVRGYKMLDYNTCTELFHKIRGRINIIEHRGEVARYFRSKQFQQKSVTPPKMLHCVLKTTVTFDNKIAK